MSDDDHSLSSIELMSLRRSSTIESGRQLEAMAKEPRRRGAPSRKLGFFAGRTDSHQDTIQKLLASATSEMENARSTHDAPDLQHLRRLSQEYCKLKERPAALCHRLFSYWCFPTTTQDAVATNEQFRGLLEKNETVSAWMCRVASMLGGDTRDGSQLIYCSRGGARSEDLPSFFSFRQFAQAAISGDLKSIHSAPVGVLFFIVSVTWGVDLQPWVPGFDTQDAHELVRPMPHMLPSLRSARKVTSEASRHIRWGSTSQKEGNLDSNWGDNEIFLSWRRSVTTFRGDLNVYIWEPHTRFPSTEYAKIILCPPQHQGGTMRPLVSLRSCRLLAAYNDKWDTYSAQESVPALGGTESQSSQTPFCQYSACWRYWSQTQMTSYEHTTKNQRAWVLSRQNPTNSKLRFMMHLEDSRKIASDGVKHATSVLDNLTALAEDNTQIRAEAGVVLHHADKVAALHEDLEFCGRELERLRSYTEADQETLRQHFQLSQDLKLFKLTILAAIFLPLSFTTSLFGMNIRSTEECPWAFSEVTSSTLQNITDTNMRSSAEALVSIIASSGNLNYDWTVFAGTAIGLVFILPFTLAVGTVMRTTVVSVVRYVKNWRMLTLLIGGVVGLVVMATSILGLFLERVFTSKYLDAIRTADRDRWLEERDRWNDVLSSLGYFVYAYWATNGFLILMLIFLVYQSWSERKERFFWTTQMLVTAACFTADMLGSRAAGNWFPSMITPWVWLGLFKAWVRRRWWRAWFTRWR